MSFRKRAIVVVFGLVATVVVERDARAQIHGDVGVNLGVMDRVRSGGAGNGELGPLAEIEAHIAVLPLLRVGVYASHDIAPNSIDGAAWHVTSGGVHVKVLAPFVRGAYRAWFFTGLGYAGIYAPSYNYKFDFSDSEGPRNTYATGAGGSFFEVPVGLGFGWRFAKPWELVVQLGARINFDFIGSLYNYDTGRAVIPDGGPVYFNAPVGTDHVAPFLTVGIALDR